MDTKWPKKKNTLVLGTTWPSRLVLTDYHRSKKTSTQTRDYERLNGLQHCGNFRVLAVSHEEPVPMSDEHFILASFTRRGAKYIANIAKMKCLSKIEFIFCDFFRFPGEYMDIAYSTLRNFIDELQKQQMLHENFVLFAPHRTKIRNQFLDSNFEISFIKALENPLYKATFILQERHPKALHGYNLERQLSFTKPNTNPFMKIEFNL